MGLSNNEIVRLRAELGYDAVQVANPYLTAYALFETIIKQYVESGGETTSSTAVTATGGDPVVVTLTLAAMPVDSDGNMSLSAGDRVIIDVDEFTEKATVRAIDTLTRTIDVMLALAHPGTYRVMVDGGVAMVREKLYYIRTLTEQIQDYAPTAGVKKADEVEFHSPEQMSKVLGPAFITWLQRDKERAELADFLGVAYLRAIRHPQGAGGSMVIY